ncbi:MAG TPA: hypothetical protein VN540_07500 [Clostridia bacterium]|nr:hypothetical protein [Clostridia bacterium]
MDPGIFILLIVVAVFVSAIAKAKKQQQRRVPPDQSTQGQQPNVAQTAQLEAQRRAATEAERRRRAAMGPQPARPTVSVMPGDWHCVCGNDNARNAAFCTKCGRKRAEGQTGSLEYYSTEGQAVRGDMEGASMLGDTEGVSSEGRTGSALVAAKPSLRHVVRSVTESTHAHTEGSASLEEGAPCEQEYDPHTRDSYELTGPDAYEISQEKQGLPLGMKLSSRTDFARAILYAEILGKPKAMRGR